MQTTKNNLPITILKLFPGILSILIILAGNFGLFKGQNKYYTLPFFLLLICVHMTFAIKYKLADKLLFISYFIIATFLILIRIFIR